MKSSAPAPDAVEGTEDSIQRATSTVTVNREGDLVKLVNLMDYTTLVPRNSDPSAV